MSAQVGAQTSPTTTFEAWVASKGAAVGPPGTTSVLTPLAARELWDREARGADVLERQPLRHERSQPRGERATSIVDFIRCALYELLRLGHEQPQLRLAVRV